MHSGGIFFFFFGGGGEEDIVEAKHPFLWPFTTLS